MSETYPVPYTTTEVPPSAGGGGGGGGLTKATGAEVNTGTDDAKYVTPKAIEDSDYAKTAAIPVKASGADINTGTDDAKYVTSKAIEDSDLRVFSVVDDTAIRQGVDAQDTSLLKVRAGAMPALAEDTSNAPGNLVFTAVANGTSGNSVTVDYAVSGINTPLSVSVVGNAITVHLATDGDGNPTISTGTDILNAIQASGPASALITVALAAGNDGTGVPPGGESFELAGGIAAGTSLLEVGNRGATVIQSLEPILGAPVFIIKDESGAVVAHVDDDGGVVFSSGNFTTTQFGNTTVNFDSDGNPLVGSNIFEVKTNNSVTLSVAPGGGYGTSIGSKVATDRVLVLAAFTAQSANILEARDENDVVATAIGPDGTVFQHAPASTPAASLLNGQISFFLDEVGNKLKVAVRYSDGTAKVGEMALT